MAHETLETEQADAEVVVNRHGAITVDTIEIIRRDGREIARSKDPHTQTFVPGSDVSGASPRVQAMSTAVWTPEVVAAHEARVAAEAARQE